MRACIHRGVGSPWNVYKILSPRTQLLSVHLPFHWWGNRLVTAWSKRGNELANFCEINKVLFSQKSWVRTSCCKCSAERHCFLVPSSPRQEEQLCGPGGLSSERLDRNKAVNTCPPCHCVYKEQLIKNAKLCEGKGRQPSQQKNFSDMLLSCSYTSSRVPGNPGAYYICLIRRRFQIRCST